MYSFSTSPTTAFTRTAWGTKSDICIKVGAHFQSFFSSPVSTFLLSIFSFFTPLFRSCPLLLFSPFLYLLSPLLFSLCLFIIIYTSSSSAYHHSLSTHPRSLLFDNDNFALLLFVYHFPSIFSPFRYAHAHPFAHAI